jgi:TonB family protein
LSVGPGQTPRLAVGEGYPSLVSKVDPEYTEQARRTGLSGTVLLRTVIDENGVPTQVAVIRGLGSGLDEKAIECVKQWRFHPAVTKDGRPIPVEVSLEVNFSLPKDLSQGSAQPIQPVPAPQARLYRSLSQCRIYRAGRFHVVDCRCRLGPDLYLRLRRSSSRQ